MTVTAPTVRNGSTQIHLIAGNSQETTTLLSLETVKE